MKKCLLIFFLIVIPFFTKAQSDTVWQVKAKFKIEKPVQVSFDKKNKVYFSDAKGSVHQYSLEGKHLLSYAPEKLAKIDFLEAWQGIKIFAYYQDFQEFIILDRFFNITSRQSFDFDLVEFAQVATLAFDDNVWLFDSGSFSLKKYNPLTNQVLINTSLDLILNSNNYDLNFMREYQNTLFLSDKNSGILVFDNLGNYKKLIPYPSTNFLGAWEDELYFLEGNRLVFFHLYRLEKRNQELPQYAEWLFALYFGKHLVLFSKNELYFLEQS